MTFTNWRAMESAMRGSQPQQRITRATLRRVTVRAPTSLIDAVRNLASRLGQPQREALPSRHSSEAGPRGRETMGEDKE